jgi:hypothetical protein
MLPCQNRGTLEQQGVGHCTVHKPAALQHNDKLCFVTQKHISAREGAASTLSYNTRPWKS